ncbi:hypothetical protein [Peterkaempfera bronchialis]|uniref:hypothetical protein n=1 Tax=Peterkaempfera bronchialis TaxID=2126346 RepID=UPI003C2CBB45
MPHHHPVNLIEAEVARASTALQEIEELAGSLNAEQAAEVIQWLGLRPGPAHRLAAAVTALGTQLATELGEQPEVWEPVLDAGTRIAAAGFRAAGPVGEVLYGSDRHRAAVTTSPAIRAAGPGAEVQAAPIAVALHARIVEPPRR